MKIVAKNKTNILAVHDGMPFIFDVDAMKALMTAKPHGKHVQTLVGAYLDKEHKKNKVYRSCKYSRLLVERLEERL